MAATRCSIRHRTYWERRQADLPDKLRQCFQFIAWWQRSHYGSSPTLAEICERFTIVKTTAKAWLADLIERGCIETERLPHRIRNAVLKGRNRITLNWRVFNAYAIAKVERRRERQREALAARAQKSRAQQLSELIPKLSRAIQQRFPRGPVFAPVVNQPLDASTLLRKKEHREIEDSAFPQPIREPDIFELSNRRWDQRKA